MFDVDSVLSSPTLLGIRLSKLALSRRVLFYSVAAHEYSTLTMSTELFRCHHGAFEAPASLQKD